MKLHALNPQLTLQDFFYLNTAFAFHDQTKADEQFTCGESTYQYVTTDGGTQESAFHLLTSSEGGMATLIHPSQTLPKDKIKDYITSHITSSYQDVSLTQISPNISIFLAFSATNNVKAHTIAFDDSKLAVTHDESNQIVKAIQGTKNCVNIITHAAFNVNSRVKASLSADWRQILIIAVEKKYHQLDSIKTLISQEIDNNTIQLTQTFENTPSNASKSLVLNHLIDTAARLACNTLEGVTGIDELPDTVDYSVTYSNALPQAYCIEKSDDMAELFSLLPFSSMISHSPQPLPEPNRKPIDKPTHHQECKVSLNFQASDFQITEIVVLWGENSTPMSWPNFPSVVLNSNDEINNITIKTTFADYTTFETQIPWNSEVTLSISDIGYREITFNAETIKSDFKNISGTATYYPNESKQKSRSFNFYFSGSEWRCNWQLNTNSKSLNGIIEYQWSGKPDSYWSKTFQSGSIKTENSLIELQYQH